MMKLLGRPLEDLVPPIIFRRLRKLGKLKRFHPFDCVPPRLEAKWVLDIGANIGDVAAAAFRSYPDCSVICFEPVSATFATMKERLTPYGKRAIFYNKALSDENGKGEINLTSFHGANSIMPQSEFHKKFNPHIREVGKETIELVRLDDIGSEFPIDWIDIMKIDVEGYELNVLRGGREFLASKVDVVIVEASLMRDQSWEHQSIVDVFSLLHELGFDLVNAYDLNKSDDDDMMLVQMDCVFRHRSKLV